MPLLHFPTYTTSFIGRESDLAMVSKAVQNHRLVSLVGTSGTGKTRLSQEVARTLEAHFADGCVFVGLAAVQDSSYLIPTIAHALDVDSTTATPPLEQLITTLATKQMLVILDNVEQIVDAAAEIEHIFAHTTTISFLITSQERLHIEHERVVNIPPLGIPSSTSATSVADLLKYPAVALFVDRLRHIRPDFEPTTQSMPIIKEICQRLHGLPLAIELVAANSRTLPLRDVLLLLKNYLPPIDPDRPLTRAEIIQPVLAWCHKIMSNEQQKLYPRLGIFHGGWTLEQAQQVCSMGLKEAVDSLHEQLLQRHILLAEQQEDGSLRYGMVDAIVEDTRTRLSQVAEQAALAQAHALYFRDFVVHSDQSLQPGDSIIEEFNRLEAERANIRAALNWSVATQNTVCLAQIVQALGRFWVTRGDLREAARWVEQAQVHLDSLADELQAGVLYAAGSVYFNLGQIEAAQAAWQQSAALYEAQGEQALVARLWNNLAACAAMLNHVHEAREWFSKALAVHRAQGNAFFEAMILNNLAVTHFREAEYAAALQLNHEAAAICRRIAAQDLLTPLVNNLGSCYVELGDDAAAIPLLEESLELYKHVGNIDTFEAQAYLGFAYGRAGDNAKALLYLGAALTQCLDVGSDVKLSEVFAMYARYIISFEQHDLAAQVWALAKILRQSTGIPRAYLLQEIETRLQQPIADYMNMYAALDAAELENVVAKISAELQAFEPHIEQTQL